MLIAKSAADFRSSMRVSAGQEYILCALRSQQEGISFRYRLARGSIATILASWKKLVMRWLPAPMSTTVLLANWSGENPKYSNKLAISFLNCSELPRGASET